jgi:hypothetical protein
VSFTRQNGAKSRHTPAYPSTKHPRSFAKAKNASSPRRARGGEGARLGGQEGGYMS